MYTRASLVSVKTRTLRRRYADFTIRRGNFPLLFVPLFDRCFNRRERFPFDELSGAVETGALAPSRGDSVNTLSTNIYYYFV